METKIIGHPKTFPFFCAIFFLILLICGVVILLPIKEIGDFGLIILVFIVFSFFLIQVLPGSSYLMLKEDGFVVKFCYFSKFHKWGEIKDFYVWHTTDPVMSYPWEIVTWKYRNSPRQRGQLLWSSYGMKPKELASLLNKYRLKTLV